MAIGPTGRLDDVVDGNIIESAWGNAVRDRSVTPYAVSTDATTGTQPPNGALCVTLDDNRVLVRVGNGWRVLGAALLSAGQLTGTAVGSTQTGIASATVVCSITIPSALWKRAVLVDAVCRLDNETAAAGVLGVRLESGSTWTQALAQYPATAAYISSFALSYATTIPAGSALSINMTAFRQSGTCTGKSWSDGTINRINYLCVPCP